MKDCIVVAGVSAFANVCMATWMGSLISSQLFVENRHESFRFQRKGVHVQFVDRKGRIDDAFVSDLIGEKCSDNGTLHSSGE